MRKIVWVAIATVLMMGGRLSYGQLVDFDELVLAPDSYFDGYGAGATSGSWETGGTSFNTNQYGPGWSYSNVSDTTTPGFTNQWSAITGAGVGGAGNYALANGFTANGAYFNLPTGKVVQNVRVTNSTYAALSMRDGDAFAKKFGGATGDDADFFKVTFAGFSNVGATGDSTGSVEVYLADYRFADNQLDYIVNQWTEVDLVSLGRARSVAIEFESSDIGAFGMNTPAYVAIDDLNLASIPEPGSSLVLLGMLAAGMAFRRSRRA